MQSRQRQYVTGTCRAVHRFQFRSQLTFLSDCQCRHHSLYILFQPPTLIYIYHLLLTHLCPMHERQRMRFSRTAPVPGISQSRSADTFSQKIIPIIKSGQLFSEKDVKLLHRNKHCHHKLKDLTENPASMTKGYSGLPFPFATRQPLHFYTHFRPKCLPSDFRHTFHYTFIYSGGSIPAILHRFPLMKYRYSSPQEKSYSSHSTEKPSPPPTGKPEYSSANTGKNSHIAAPYCHERFSGHNVSNKKIPVARQIVNRNKGYAIKECKVPNTYSTYFNF